VITMMRSRPPDIQRDGTPLGNRFSVYRIMRGAVLSLNASRRRISSHCVRVTGFSRTA
jgi:hypothetical protein